MKVREEDPDHKPVGDQSLDLSEDAEAEPPGAKEPARLFEYALQSAGEAIMITTASFEPPGPVIVFVNHAMIEMSGYESVELIGKSADILHGPHTDPLALELCRRSLAQTGTFFGEIISYRKDGAEFDREFRITPIRNEAGEVTHFVSIQRDVTGQRQVERELRKNEERYRAFVEQSSEGIYCCEFHEPISVTLSEDEQIDLFYKYSYIAESNDAFAQMYGLASAGEIKGKPVGELLTRSDPRNIEYLRAFVLSGYHLTDVESHELDHEGNSKYFLNNLIGIIEKEMVVRVWGTQRGITDRKLAEKELEDQKERLAVTLRSIAEGVIATDTNGKIVLLNNTAEKLTGWGHDEAIGRPLEDIFKIVQDESHQPCESIVERVLRTGNAVSLPSGTLLIDRNGREWMIADSGSPIKDRDGQIVGVVIVFSDVTRRQQIEEELMRARKLESLGLLAGGIAHNFNNLLAAILGNISLARIQTDPQQPVYRRIAEAEQACLRAKDLTQQLLTFSRGGAPVKKSVSLVDILKESASFAITGSNARCEFSIAEDLWQVEIDSGQISQVIHNLVLNAQQSMPDGGVINIDVENTTVGEDKKTSTLSEWSGRYVKLSIRDHGVGIPQENLSKIFDPYFTTKPSGSGLGLASAYSIIRNHDGYLAVESRAGDGTTIYTYIPASANVATLGQSEEMKPMSGKGRVLVMDDDDVIRYLVGEMLLHLGYESAPAAEGFEAIKMYKTAMDENRRFDVVIMDLTIAGGLGGRETINRLREIDPSIKAVVSSGYSNDPVMANFQEYGFSGVIAKPYKIAELSETLHKLLAKD
jgi:PAS domain S-box-containing protein